MKVVLDTNVVVSGFLHAHQAPGQILQRVGSKNFLVLYDALMLTEYREVLLRRQFDLVEQAVDAFLRVVQLEGMPIIPQPLVRRLPDPDDEAFLEVAVAGQADFLITGNLKHFPLRHIQGVRIVSPRDFLEVLRKFS